mmetsp:Transcript_9961/g.18535  ORF Transcript_9961/g.18535 Transcript_9961/m.18535 type:complete len:161 (-) Transcript_9961:308-790(-)
MLRNIAKHPALNSLCSGRASSYLYRTSRGFSATGDEEKRQAMANKLMYRSKQRGFLELDLLIGLWAEHEIPKMSFKELDEMSNILDQENPDLFKWLTGQLPASEDMVKNSVYQKLKSHVDVQIENSPLKSRATPGQDWVRGWDDGWKAAAKQAAENKAAK